MKKLIPVSIVIVLVTALIYGRGIKSAAAQTTALAQTSVSSGASSIPSWQNEWNRTVAAGTKEGKVVIYTTAIPATRTSVADVFKKRYNITVEYIVGRGSELLPKLTQERKAGLYLADLYIAGATTQVNDMKPRGMLDPLKPLLILPEVTDPKGWWAGRLYFCDKEAQYALGFSLYAVGSMAQNTDLVKPQEIKSYKDFLNPKWKGKLVLGDPTVPGSGLRLFSTVGGYIMGMDYMRELAKQEPLITRDQRQATEWVARGKYPIVIGIVQEVIESFKKVGAPLNYISPSEGTWLSSSPGVISLINKSAHPNAAKVFLNWLLTKEGQTVYSRASGIQSARVDVPTDHLDADWLRDPAAKYLFADDADVLSREEEFTKLAKDIFRSLLK